jgi:amidase
MFRVIGLAAGLAMLAAAAHAQTTPFASYQEQQAAMKSGALTAETLLKSYLARIRAIDDAGPRLNAVLALNPHALADARALDAERKAGKVRGPLHGIPVLLKDNIESADGTATTAGSLALKDNVTNRDAPIVRRLTDAGAVIVGKANLSEWANFRSTRSISGWSAVAGLVRNPFSLDRTACGSSAGSGAAIAAGLATLAVGTETDGSITCPAAITGVVGLKPTVGLLSRTYIVPISPQQDTPGPMTRYVADAAAMLTVMAGSDPADPMTAQADAHKTDYVAALDARSLQGARIGVLRANQGRSSQTDQVFETALAAMKKAGAVLVEVKAVDDATLGKVAGAEGEVLRIEFKAALNGYLATLPAAVKSRTLDDLIAFNGAEPRETPLFGQEIFDAASKAVPITDPTYLEKRASATKLAREALDKMLAENDVVALVGPSTGPASIVDTVNSSRGSGSYSTLPAISGYPHLTVPMGFVTGLPVGISFLGPAWSEARLLSLGYAFEQATHARRDPPFLPNLAARPEIARAFDPPH